MALRTLSGTGILACVLLVALYLRAQAPAPEPQPAFVDFTCPMDPEVRSKTPGKCPRCGMTLVPVSGATLKRLQPGGQLLYYTGPMPEDSDVRSDKPGKCPKCGMTLIPVMEAPSLPKSPPSAKEAMPEGMVMPEHQH